ncbi:MAG: ATPase, T2SS/T4P/T4SS family, partial [Thermoplasmatales archaeon]
LVLCTVHANTPGGVVSRFTGLGVSRDDISSTLTLVISQRLVKTLSGDRTGIFSLVPITRPLADAIANGSREHEFDELSRRLGFLSLYDRAISLVEAGVISQQEADRFRDEKIQHISTTDTSESLKPLIMLVEDNFETAEVLAKLFESRFFKVITAQDGIDALEKLAKTSPQLIVSDIMMPRMSGIDLLKKIRSNPKTARIPVVMLTAVDTDEKELQSLEVGADDFISKAEDPQIIVARVERILTRLRFNP